MTDSAPVRLERDGDVAVVVLDNPPLNLFTPAVFPALDAVVGQLVALTDPQRTDRARAVLFEARGKVVSGGVDVAFFRDIAEGPEPVARGGELWAQLLRVAQTVEDLPVPTVFAAHGLTLTAAFELALACDILLAAEKASFGLVEIVVGLTPSMGGPQRLAERAGPGPRQGADLHRRAVSGRRPRAVGRRQPRAARTTGSPRRPATTPAGSRPARRWPTRPPSGWSTTAVRRGRAGRRRPGPGGLRALFATADLRGAVASFLTDGPGKATYSGR